MTEQNANQLRTIQFSTRDSQGILHTSEGKGVQTTLVIHSRMSVVGLANGSTLVLTPQPLLCGERSVGP